MDKLNDKLREYLTGPRFAVAATINQDGAPQQTVVWYELQQDDRIMMNTRVGRLKEKNLRRDPRMSICVGDDYRYLTIKGRVTLNYDKEQALADIKTLAIRYYGQEKGEQKTRDVYGKQDRVTIYLTIEDIHEYEI